MDFRSEKFNLIIIFFVAQKYTNDIFDLIDLRWFSIGIEYLNLVNKYMYILFIISFNLSDIP